MWKWTAGTSGSFKRYHLCRRATVKPTSQNHSVPAQWVHMDTCYCTYWVFICLSLYLSLSYLFNRDQDDVAGHDLDDVDLQQPPDEQLQFVEILQELKEEHGQTVDHQVPFILQVWRRGDKNQIHLNGKNNRTEEVQMESVSRFLLLITAVCPLF